MQPDVFEMIAKDKSQAEIQRDKNRALAAKHMPQFLWLCDELRREEMFGRVVSFQVNA